MAFSRPLSLWPFLVVSSWQRHHRTDAGKGWCTKRYCTYNPLVNACEHCVYITDCFQDKYVLDTKTMKLKTAQLQLLKDARQTNRPDEGHSSHSTHSTPGGPATAATAPTTVTHEPQLPQQLQQSQGPIAIGEWWSEVMAFLQHLQQSQLTLIERISAVETRLEQMENRLTAWRRSSHSESDWNDWEWWSAWRRSSHSESDWNDWDAKGLLQRLGVK